MSAAPTGDRDGRHSRWNRHREERRRHILDAAIAVVEEAPAGAELRLQDVSERSGLVRTVVQRHFGGQVGLLRAVQADVLEQAFALITEPLELSASLHEIAASMVGTTIEWVDGHPALHALVEREVGDGEVLHVGAGHVHDHDFRRPLAVLPLEDVLPGFGGRRVRPRQGAGPRRSLNVREERDLPAGVGPRRPRERVRDRLGGGGIGLGLRREYRERDDLGRRGGIARLGRGRSTGGERHGHEHGQCAVPKHAATS